MDKFNKEQERGFVGMLVMILIGLLALKYFLNWDIFDAAATKEGQGTIAYLRQIVNTVWSYIGFPVTFAWNTVVKPLTLMLWHTLLAFIEWGKSNAATGV